MTDKQETAGTVGIGRSLICEIDVWESVWSAMSKFESV